MDSFRLLIDCSVAGVISEPKLNNQVIQDNQAEHENFKKVDRFSEPEIDDEYEDDGDNQSDYEDNNKHRDSLTNNRSAKLELLALGGLVVLQSVSMILKRAGK